MRKKIIKENRKMLKTKSWKTNKTQNIHKYTRIYESRNGIDYFLISKNIVNEIKDVIAKKCKRISDYRLVIMKLKKKKYKIDSIRTKIKGKRVTN